MSDEIKRDAAPSSGNLSVEQAIVPATLGLWWANPGFMWEAQTRLYASYLQLYVHALWRMAGLKLPPVAVPTDGDARFHSAQWQTNPHFDYLKQLYLVNAQHVLSLAREAASGLSNEQRLAVRVYADQAVKQWSPSRFAATSPEGWQETARTGGFNLLQRLSKLLFDSDRRNGMFRLQVSDAADYRPGGNDTYLCVSEGECRCAYHDVDELIRNWCPYFEQGGFLERSAEPAVVRLQMAGGEFCGNAARCVAAFVANEYHTTRRHAQLVRYELIEQTGDGLAFFVEMSGATRPLAARCLSRGEDYWVEVEMPIWSRLNHTQHSIEAAGKHLRINKVEMEGIVHLLIDRRQLSFKEAPSVQRELLNRLICQLDLSQEPAVGLIWHDGSAPACQAGISIDPVVYVKATDSLTYESACGSGSLAAAIACRRSRRDNPTTSVIQPSQSTIECRLVNGKNGAIKQAFISGVVERRGTFSAPAA